MKFETIRQRRLADLIKENISQIIFRKLKDPRKGFITITRVKVSGDLRLATIFYTTLGNVEEREKSQNTLENAKSYIRNELAPILKLRFLPELRFFYDESREYAEHIETLLKKIKAENSQKKDK